MLDNTNRNPYGGCVLEMPAIIAEYVEGQFVPVDDPAPRLILIEDSYRVPGTSVVDFTFRHVGAQTIDGAMALTEKHLEAIMVPDGTTITRSYPYGDGKRELRVVMPPAWAHRVEALARHFRYGGWYKATVVDALLVMSDQVQDGYSASAYDALLRAEDHAADADAC